MKRSLNNEKKIKLIGNIASGRSILAEILNKIRD